MKAKIKETGEIVNIADYSTVYLDKYDGSYHINELEFIKDEEKQSIIDWEQRRYEIAKSAMQGMLSDANNHATYTTDVAQKAVNFANALICELQMKEECCENND